jgi:hypothetical protein
MHYLTMTRVLCILSSVSLFIVAIFYACIRELRSNIIGKIVLVMAICEAISIVAVETSLFSAVAVYLAKFLNNLTCLLFFVMVYETFVLLKY